MSYLEDAKKHAESVYPQESCGLVVEGLYYLPCFNEATDPLNDFKISAEEFASAEDLGEITMVIHSHPDQSCRPSESDKLSCEATQLPWVILEVRDGKALDHYHEMAPCGYVTPLLGRAFKHGVHDCLTIILDYYLRERGVDLGSFDREDNWWNEGRDHYRKLLPIAGFSQVTTGPEKGDVILIQIRAPVPNHAAIYLGDGTIDSEPVDYPQPGTILHHMYGRDSRRDVYGGMWVEKTVSVWRHERKT